MDERRKAELTARRKALQLTIARKEQRAALWGLDDGLAAAGTQFRLIYPDAADVPDWIGALVPAGAVHLDWPAAAGAREQQVERNALPRIAREQIAEWAAPHDLVWVVPGNGLAPIVELNRAAFDANAEAIIAVSPDLWLSGAPAWLIELRSGWFRAVRRPVISVDRLFKSRRRTSPSSPQ